MSANLYAVILAGGGGSRLWPLSREFYPKQFLSLGEDRTLFQKAVLRVAPLIPYRRQMVVTNSDLVLEVKAQLSDLGQKLPIRILREPRGRNTAAAVGIAALVLNRMDPSAIMAVLPADHRIQKSAVFVRLLKFAGELAGLGHLVTFGIRPDRPETGYGYIKLAKRVAGRGALRAHAVRRFVEKPDLKTARRYLAQGGYCWNSGIFVWKVSVILAELRRSLPDLYAGLMEIGRSLGTKKEDAVLRRVYDRIRSISIDYGVLEKSAGVVVVPADMGWSDVGDWTAVQRQSRRDRSGNATIGNSIMLDGKNSMVYSPRRIVASIGLEDTFVVDTEDALLVCRKDRAQDVRRVVDILKSRRSQACLLPHMVRKPWGTYEILQTAPTFQVKRLVLNPGASISLQQHLRRSEHWVVVSGEARVTHDRRVYTLKKNQSTYIPPRTRHALANETRAPLEIIEVQSGEYLGEDDIIRFEDRYGRCDPSPPLTALP